MTPDAIRGAVSAVASATAALQESVQHEVFLADTDAKGGKAYADPVPISCLVQRKEGVLNTAAGKEARYRAILSILDPSVVIGPRDRLTLTGGITGPIITPTGGLVDPGTGNPYIRIVHLGAS